MIYNITGDIKLGDTCEKKSQLRPHIVWFGESVPMFEKAIEITSLADCLIIIGSSMQVYPAANLIYAVEPEIPIYFIDPKPNVMESHFKKLTVIAESATVGMEKLLQILVK